MANPLCEYIKKPSKALFAWDYYYHGTLCDLEITHNPNIVCVVHFHGISKVCIVLEFTGIVPWAAC